MQLALLYLLLLHIPLLALLFLLQLTLRLPLLAVLLLLLTLCLLLLLQLLLARLILLLALLLLQITALTDLLLLQLLLLTSLILLLTLLLLFQVTALTDLLLLYLLLLANLILLLALLLQITTLTDLLLLYLLLANLILLILPIATLTYRVLLLILCPQTGLVLLLATVGLIAGILRTTIILRTASILHTVPQSFRNRQDTAIIIGVAIIVVITRLCSLVVAVDAQLSAGYFAWTQATGRASAILPDLWTEDIDGIARYTGAAGTAYIIDIVYRDRTAKGSFYIGTTRSGKIAAPSPALVRSTALTNDVGATEVIIVITRRTGVVVNIRAVQVLLRCKYPPAAITIVVIAVVIDVPGTHWCPAVVSVIGRTPIYPSRRPFIAGDPYPAIIAVIRPAAIVEGCPSPAIIGDPGIPVIGHGPVTIGIIRAEVLIYIGYPDIAILRIIDPLPVRRKRIVEILVGAIVVIAVIIIIVIIIITAVIVAIVITVIVITAAALGRYIGCGQSQHQAEAKGCQLKRCSESIHCLHVLKNVCD